MTAGAFLTVDVAGVGPVRRLPPDFGAGWLTNAAHDTLVIALAFAGLSDDDATALVRRVACAQGRGRRVNAATVERLVGEVMA